MFKRFIKGFTLIELIIVIAVIALLSVAILVVVDPARRIGETRNAVRASDAKNIKKALEYYLGEYQTLPPALAGLTNGTNYMIAAVGDTSGASVSCSAVGSITKVDITNGTSNLFTYLPTIPIDPEQSAPYTNGSGYYFQKQGNKILDIKACNVYTYAANDSGGGLAVCGNGIVEGAEVCDAGVYNLPELSGMGDYCGLDLACQDANNSTCDALQKHCKDDCSGCSNCGGLCM